VPDLRLRHLQADRRPHPALIPSARPKIAASERCDSVSANNFISINQESKLRPAAGRVPSESSPHRLVGIGSAVGEACSRFPSALIRELAATGHVPC
jgi:hypothetical protein